MGLRSVLMNLQSTFRHSVFAVIAATSVVAINRPTVAATIAYYQFETDGSGTGPTLNLGAGATIVPGKFGNALDGVGGSATGASINDDGLGSAGALRQSFTNFTVSFWLKPDAWSGTARFITGKVGGSTQRGWYVSKTADQRLDFAAYQGTTNTPSSYFASTSALALSASAYTHIAATFNASGSMNLYANGIKVGGGAITTTALNGINTAAFEIGGTANAGTTRIAGNFDDYVIADDFMSPEKIALINGLGQLAGVSMTNESDINNVLATYLSASGSAVAGGNTWAYSSNVGGGNIVGTRGGSVGTGDAFIVLGSDGSGISIIPEPTTLAIAAFGLLGIAWIRRKPTKFTS
jgi:hypothetical protein